MSSSPTQPTMTLDELLEALEELDERHRFRKLDFYEPYPKQMQFHNRKWREGLLRAGNQEGKTYCGAAEMAYHLTGLYPAWWTGRKFDKAITAWAAGESATVTRDKPQKELFGTPGVDEDFGTGFVPKELIVGNPSMSRGVTDAYDTVHVRHVSGGISSVIFKSYEQGRKKFQSGTIDVVWGDEEPPADVYAEMIARITATDGMIYITFTPLNGMSEVVSQFLEHPNENRGEVVMTIYDAKHIKKEDIPKILEGYPVWQRAARAMGEVLQGEGRVFPFDDAAIIEEPIPVDYIPAHWVKLWGIDFGHGGGAHPFAAVLILWDKETDTIHVHAARKTQDQMIVQHCSLIKSTAVNVRVAWPHDGQSRELGHSTEGKTLAQLYKDEGLKMLDQHATWPDGTNGVYAGIQEITDRVLTGRFKVAKHLMASDFGDEWRNYHYKDGLIVKIKDDMLSALRYAIMMKRFATTTALGSRKTVLAGPTTELAQGIDFDPFS